MLWSDFAKKIFSERDEVLDDPRPAENLADNSALLYATSLLSGIKEEIDRADAKASIMLASSGVAAGALLAGLIAGTWTPLELGATVQWLWWLGVAEAAAGICCLGWVVYPRRSTSDSESLQAVGYYGDVLDFRTTAELVAALDRSAATNIERTADQIRQVSKIAHFK